MNHRAPTCSGDLDYFPTPPWATRALMECVICDNVMCDSVLEPAAGAGHMSKALEEYFSKVYASDIEPRADGIEKSDFLNDDILYDPDWVITNPPFNLAEEFINKALSIARSGVAMFVRSNFSEGVGRYERLFSKNPPTIIAQFSERVPLVKNRYDATASTATAYCWMVWFKGQHGTKMVWIPPCKKELFRQSDLEIG